MRKPKDLTGVKFGRLTVLSLNEEESNKHRGKDNRKIKYWNCQCDCGNIVVVRANDLKGGATKSCGCLRNESVKKTHTGRKRSEETKRKISEAHKGKCKEYMRGENNPNWNPNLTDEERDLRRLNPEHKQWAKEIKKQANYTCDCCGKCGSGDLVSHHLYCVKHFPERRYDITNGVCLCEQCHIKFHIGLMRGYEKPCTKQDYEDFKIINQLIVKENKIEELTQLVQTLLDKE